MNMKRLLLTTSCMVGLAYGVSAQGPVNGVTVTGSTTSTASSSGVAGTPYTGNGGASGVPLFIVLDSATGTATYATTAQFNALLAGGLIQIPPSAPAIALGTATYSTIPYTITASATGTAPIVYQVNYRPTGTTSWLAAGSSSTTLTGTIAVSPSTPYDVEVVAGNGGGTTTSAIINVTTPAEPPEAVSSLATTGSGYTANSPVSVTFGVQYGSTVYLSASTGGAEQGSRVLASLSGNTGTGSVTPTAAGAYTIGAYAAATGGTALATTPSFSVAVQPPGTTVSSAVLASDGKTLTVTFNQNATIVAADWSFKVAGNSVTATNTDAATSSTSHVFTLPTVNQGLAVTYSATPTSAATPALSTVVTNASVTNNSTATGTVLSFAGAAGTAPTGTAALASVSQATGNFEPPTVDGSGNLNMRAHYEYTYFSGSPQYLNPNITVNYGPANAAESVVISLRVSGTSPSTGYLITLDNGNAALASLAGNNVSIGSYSGNLSTVNVIVNGSTFTLKVNGVQVGSPITDTQVTGAGYFGVGTLSNSNLLSISSVSVTGS